MGHKINPNGYRYGINKNWQSKWTYLSQPDKLIAKWVVEDEKIRKYFDTKYKDAKVVQVLIDRPGNKQINVTVFAGQPGIILSGKKEQPVLKTDAATSTPAEKPAAKVANTELILKDLYKITHNIYKPGKTNKMNISLNVLTHENTTWSAKIVAREIADDIENRVSFRQAQKQAIRRVMARENGVKGIKTRVSGRLGGVEMARVEGYSEGVIPMTTLRTDLDYAVAEAHCTYGKIGVKVWINRGIILKKGLDNQNKPTAPKIERFDFKRPFNKKPGSFNKGGK